MQEMKKDTALNGIFSELHRIEMEEVVLTR